MNRSRLFAASILAFGLTCFSQPLFAVDTDFKVLIDGDNDTATGCNVSTMPGVDHVLVTRVSTNATEGTVIRTFRQTCVAGSISSPVELANGWSAGFQPASGQLLVETSMPLDAFGASLPANMRLGLEAVQGIASHRALHLPNGSPVLFPTPRHRRAVGHPGSARVITLDGNGNDWNGLNALFDGIASSGTPGLRMLKAYVFADVEHDTLSFRIDANLSTDAPFASDDDYERTLGEGLSVPAPGVLTNDGDPNGLPLTATPITDAAHGTVTLNLDGSFTYTPNDPASSLNDAFEYKATNGAKDSNAARVRIAVTTASSTAPSAVDDAFGTNEDETLDVATPGVLANDSDPNDDPLTAALLSAPTHGSVVLNADGGFTYTPEDNYFGTDSFTYTVSDGTNSDTATVNITIASVNDTPQVNAATFSIPENSAAGTVVGTVTVDDVDTADTHTFSITGGNTGGAFAIDPNSGQITVANASELDFESDSQYVLTVRADDDGSPSEFDTASITINVTDVNEVPVAVDDAYGVDEDGTLTVPAPGVLSNDSDPDGDSLEAVLVSGVTSGSLTLNADGSFTYTPNADFNGGDSFTYRATDGSLDSTAVTVSITVNPVNDPPSFTSGGPVASNEDTVFSAPWATAVSAGPADEAGQARNFTVTGNTNPGLFSAGPAISSTGVLSFTPAADANGSADITVVLTDNGGGTDSSAPVTFTITVNPVNDVPSFVEGADVVVEDNDGAQVVANWATSLSPGPANEAGQLLDFIVGNDTPSLFTVQPAIAPNGTLSFTPAVGQDGIATITVQIHDNGGTANGGVDTSAAQTLVITVEKAPTITSPATTTFVVGQAGTFNVTTTGRPRPDIAMTGVLPSGVTFVDGSGPTQGTGVLSGTPAPLTGGSYPLTFQATNVRGSSPVQNFTLIVNEAPAITSPNVATFTQGTPGTFTITTTGFPDPALGLSGATLPTGLSFLDNGDGTATISGTPTVAGGSYGGFTVTASNGVGTNATQGLTINVNEAPVITSAASTNLQAGVSSPFTVTTTGFPTPTIAHTGTLPTGVTFTDNGDGTATLGGVAVNGSGGVYSITITATNAAGNDPQTFTITVCNNIVVNNPATTTGTAGSAFSQTFTESGAVGSATFTTASTLPAGLTLATNGVLSGTPTETGSFPIVVTVTDANGCTGTGATYTLVIGCQTITVTNPANANGTASSAFSETFTQTGAIGSATFTVASGTLPAGLTLAANGVLSGTPTQTGAFPITVTVTDANGCTGTGATYTLIIGCQTITVTNPANSNGTAAAPFTETFTESGSIGSATFTVASGTLPAGLTLAGNGVLSGTPTQTGSFPITVTATDANGCTGTSATYTIVIACQTIAVTNPANTNGTAGAAFSETFTQSGAIGTATFTTASTLPAGLTLATNGVLSGTPTQTGSFPIVVTVTDANGCTGTGATYTLVIACQTITVTNPANGAGTVNAAFSETFTQSGAIGTATFTTASTLPAGLTLATNGVLSGVPTEDGSFPIVVTVTDSNGCTGTSATYNLVIACQTITVTNPANDTGPAGSPFSETFTQSGAIGTATFTTASTLPTGLTLSTAGVLSGTPGQGGTFPITVTVTDANGCTGTNTTYNLVITCPVITVTNPANASGTANAAFSETFTESGSIGGATFTLNSGTLPAGLTLSTAGVLSGTPTQTGNFPITVLVTDGNGCTGTSATYNLTIACQTITVTNPANASGTADSAFSETFTESGSIGTATFTTSSTLPAGLTLSTAGVLSGTPTQTGNFPITVTVTDANGCTGTSATYNLTIACQTITVTNPANANGTILVAFSETFTQSGAIGTATFTTSDPLPNGLTLSTAGVLSGTPTVTGSFPITVLVTDSNGCTGSSSTYTIVISCQTITVTNPANANGTVNAAFSETFTQSGANGGATFTLNSGTLPNGLTLAANGVLSGTPTEDGSFPITVLVTDGNSCTGVSATYTIDIGCQAIAVTNPTNTAGTVGTAFSETFTQLGAFGSATFTTASTLPSGLSLSTAGVLSGTPTQDGTFPIVVTVTDANGCTGTSATYNLVISCQTITVTNPGVTTGTVNAAFSQQFTQTGAIGTATFTTASTLPAGLILQTDGTLTGTPTEDGSFPIVVTVTDSNGCTGSGGTYTLIISCQIITVTNPANENGTAGVAFSETFTESGAVGTATFTTSSTLPNGLTLSSAGVLSGTPTEDGTFPIVVTVTDSNGCTGVGATYNLVIACAPFTFTPNGTMPVATFGVAYSQNITITGGTGPYTITLANTTTVPTSFTFTDNGNGSATVASANPTVTGVFTFDVNVVDTASGCTETQTFSFTVAPNVQNDTYSAANGLTDSVGNTEAVAAGFSTPTTPYVTYAPSVLANDSAPGGTLSVVTASVTNAAGTITFNAAGGWSYVPALNFTGTATFSFVVASNGAQANGSISIVVANKVWYVKNDAAAGGDGRSSLPFDTLVEAETASAAGDIIYVDGGNGANAGQNAGITLKDNQQLIGEGVALVVNANTLALAGTNPLITNTLPAGDGVTLGNLNTVRGLTISGATADGIHGNAKNGFTGSVLTLSGNGGNGLFLQAMTGTAVLTNSTISTNSGSGGLVVDGGTAVVTADSTNSIGATAAFNAVNITNHATGAVTIGATIPGGRISVANNTSGTIGFTGSQTLSTGGATAVSISGNSAPVAIDFSGTLAITTAGGTGFSATGLGTLTVTGTANVTTGAATNGVVINGVTVGGAGATFNSINTTGATTGLSLTSIGNGNVTVNGGTLGATTGVSLNTLGTSNVTLNGVTVTGGTTGISGTTFGTLTITGTVNVSGPTALALNTGTVSGTFSNVSSTGGTNGVTLTGVAGTWGATAGSLTGATGVTFNVSGGSGQITWGPSISQANGNRVVSVAASNSSIINFNGDVTSSATSTGVILTASSGTYNFNATNSFTGASGILISNGQSGTISFSNATTIGNVTNTPFQVDGSAVAVTAAITYSGTIAKTSAGFLIDVNNLDSPGGTLTMTHTPSASGNLSINSTGSTGISIINSSSTNITIANASVTFQNAGAGFTSTNNTGGTINLQGSAFTGNGSSAGMLLAGGGTINVTSGAAAPSINMTGATNNAIDGTTTAFAGTLSLNNTAITGGGATAVRLGGGTLSGTGSTVTAGAQTALNLSGVALTNGAGLNSITSTGGTSGVILANVSGGTYTISGGSLTGHTTAAWVHTNSAANAATISFSGPITPAINARAIDIGGAGASTGLRGGTITLSGAITTTSNAANVNAGGIRVRNSTGGTLALSNSTLSISSNANVGVELTTNPATTFNFSGGNLTIASTTAKGFAASGGGTINITGANNTVSSTGANAFEIVGTSVVHFGGAVTLRSVTSTNGTKGISMQFFDGPFSVTGDGPDGDTLPDSVTSGGTITGSDIRGAEFIDVDGPIVLAGMTFTNPADTAGPDASVATGTCGNIPSGGSNTGCHAGIHLDTVASVTLRTVNVTGSANIGINGNSINGLTMETVNVSNSGNTSGEDGIRLYNLSGVGSITSLAVTNSFGKGLLIENTNVSLATSGSPYLITNSSFQGSSNAQGSNLNVAVNGTMHVKFLNGTVSGNFSNGIQTTSLGTGTMGIYVDNTNFSDNTSAVVVQSSGGTTNFDIRNIDHIGRTTNASCGLCIKSDGTGTATGTIISNNIGNGTVGSGASCGGGCNGINVDARNTSDMTVEIRGNTIRHVDQNGIGIRGGEGSSKLEVTVTGNLIADPDNTPGTLAAIFADSGVLSSDTNCVTVLIGGNTAWPGAPTSSAGDIQNRIEGAWGVSGVRVRKLFGAGAPPEPVFNLPGYDGSGVINWIQTRNSFSGVATLVTQNAGAGGAFTGGVNCP